MATHDWRSLDLSSRAISASEAAADLRGFLPGDFFKNEVLKSKFEALESSISAFRSAVVPSNATEGSHPSPAIKQLAQRAHDTLWDELPLSAILKAHKSRLEELAAADEDGEPSAEVYVALYKLLQLYHDPKGNPEYVRESSVVFSYSAAIEETVPHPRTFLEQWIRRNDFD